MQVSCCEPQMILMSGRLARGQFSVDSFLAFRLGSVQGLIQKQIWSWQLMGYSLQRIFTNMECHPLDCCWSVVICMSVFLSLSFDNSLLFLSFSLPINSLTDSLRCIKEFQVAACRPEKCLLCESQFPLTSAAISVPVLKSMRVHGRQLVIATRLK